GRQPLRPQRTRARGVSSVMQSLHALDAPLTRAQYLVGRDHETRLPAGAARATGTGPGAGMNSIPQKTGPARILVVEDERDIAALVAYHLAREGYRVRTADGGAEALQAVSRERPDLVILDLMLPGFSGYDVLAELRHRDTTADVPVIVLTARRDEEDRVKGLELGADDYVTKPFSPRELVLRVAAVLRRVQAPPVTSGGRMLTGGPIAVDLDGLHVTVHGRPVALT